MLDALAGARLLTVDADGVEVAHEALIREWPQLRAWLDEGRNDLRVQRHVTAAAVAWEALDRDPTELYRGQRLVAALDWLARGHHPSALERDFLTASRAEEQAAGRAQHRANRRLRILFAGVAVALVVALVAGSVAFLQGRSAGAARDRADVARLAAVSRSVVERQPDVGLLLAAEAYRREPGLEARNALLGGIEAHPILEGLLYGIDSGLEAAAFTPDGTLLATPTSDGSGTLLWDTATRGQITTLRDGDDLAFDAAMSPDGRWLAVPALTENDEDVRAHLQVWDLPARRLAGVVDSPGGILTSAWFSADGRTLVTQGGPRVDGPFSMLAVVWDTATWTPRGEPWKLADDYLDDDVIVVSPDGRLLALPQPDGTVAIWEVAGRRPLAPVAPDVSYITAMAFNPEGTTLAVAGGASRVALVDPTTGEARQPPLQLPSTESSTLEFSPDGRLLAVGSEEGRTHLFDVASGEALGPALAANASGINDVTFSRDGTRLATAGLDRTGALWRLDGQRSIATAYADHTAPVTEAHYTPDGRRLVTAGSDGKVVVRDLASGRVEQVVPVGGEVLTVALDAEGRRMAVGGTVGPVRILALATGATEAELDVGSAWVHQVAFNERGELAVAMANVGPDGESRGDDPGHVVVWDPGTGTESSPFVSPRQGSPIALAWRPGSPQLAVAFDNNVVLVHDVLLHKQVGAEIESVDNAVAALAWSPDGRRLATGSLSGIVRQWSSDTHEPVGPALEGHVGAVLGVAYSPDGRLLASTTLGFGTTRLWDALTGTSVGVELTSGRTPFDTRNFLVEHLLGSRPAFSPDSEHLATPGFDGLTTEWDLRPERWLQAACAVAGRGLTQAEWSQHVSPDGTPQPCGQGS